MTTFLFTPKNQLLDSNITQTMSLIETCSNTDQLKQIHAQMFKTQLVSNSIPASKFLTLCLSPNSGNLAYATKFFNRFNNPNTFMWNIMLRGYSQRNEPQQVLQLYHQMLSQSVSQDKYTFPSLFKACSSLSSVEEAKQIHAHIIKLGLISEVYVMNSLLHFYAIIGSTETAKLVFDRIKQRDIVTWNSIVNAYAKCGEMEIANEFFKTMPIKNVVSWTAMISGYVSVGMNKEALKLFHEMQIAGVKPDIAALSSSLSACANLGALDEGTWIHTYINKNRINVDSILGCVLIDMYAKCGNIEEALNVFKNLNNKDVSSFTALITGYAIHGQGKEALHWFRQMQRHGIEPNHVTFVAILTACSHAGLVNEGKSVFQSMKKVYNLNPLIEHYGCMVDLLGRSGLLKEAKEFMETMPLKPNATIGGALLNACRIHRHLELGKQIGKVLIKEDPAHGGRYIHLASIYAADGEWNKAVKVRKKMIDRGVLVQPGCSVISLNGVVHEFVAGDGSHRDVEEIYDMWDKIVKRLKKEGYKPVTEDLLLDVEEEVKETAVQKHSEKLAMAFGLLRTKPGKTIRIFKNLRMCKDCHNVAKLISKIFDRGIVLRDRVRFHIFREGKCSCGDYW